MPTHPDTVGVALLHWLLSGAAVLVVARLMPGIKVRSYLSAIGLAIVAGFFNTIAWHWLAPLSYAFAILTLGVGAIVVNGLVFLLAGKVVPGVSISGCFTAALASFAVTFVSWAMNLALASVLPR